MQTIDQNTLLQAFKLSICPDQNSVNQATQYLQQVLNTFIYELFIMKLANIGNSTEIIYP